MFIFIKNQFYYIRPNVIKEIYKENNYISWFFLYYMNSNIKEKIVSQCILKKAV